MGAKHEERDSGHRLKTKSCTEGDKPMQDPGLRAQTEEKVAHRIGLGSGDDDIQMITKASVCENVVKSIMPSALSSEMVTPLSKAFTRP